MNSKIGLKTSLVFLLSIFLLFLLFYKPTKIKRYEAVLIDSVHLSNETVLILVPSKVELRSDSEEEEVNSTGNMCFFIFFMHPPSLFVYGTDHLKLN